MSSSKSDNLSLGIFSIVFAVFSLSLGDALIKLLSVSFSLWQIYVIRSLVALPILLLVIRIYQSDSRFLPDAVFWVTVRSLLLVFMWIAYYTALPHIKLSLAAAVYYTIPLFITLFSSWMTGDAVGKKNWIAVCIGFMGVLIILRPDSEGFNAYALLPLIAAIFYSLAMILTRTKCIDEQPLVLSLALNVMFIIVGLGALLVVSIWDPGQQVKDLNPFLLGDWISLDSKKWIAMIILAVVVIIGSLFSAIAYQNGPSSIIASFDYSYLAFSVLWGVLFFSESLDLYLGIGMAMIAVAGIIAVRK